jgi:hypothetical protein
MDSCPHAMHPLYSPVLRSRSLAANQAGGPNYILLSAAKFTTTVLTRHFAPRGASYAAAVAARRRRGRVSASQQEFGRDRIRGLCNQGVAIATSHQSSQTLRESLS